MKAVLFDLDGTLLPMDQDRFVMGYFSMLAEEVAPLGYEKESLYRVMWGGTVAMAENDGRATNEEVFWDYFTSKYGPDRRADMPAFERFYAGTFQKARALCGFNPLAAQAVRKARAVAGQAVLATNPFFPRIATESRVRWAGLTPEDFSHITTYENSRFCKPNPAYFRQLLEELELAPEDCLMVGNDAREDTAAEQAGVRVFLVTDCLINRDNRDLSPWPHGDFPALLEYLDALQ